MPLEDWDNDHLEEKVKSLYDATALANALNALRQDIAYTPFGTSFKYEDLPEPLRSFSRKFSLWSQICLATSLHR